MSVRRWRSVEAIVGDAVTRGITPAAALLVGRGCDVLFEFEAPASVRSAPTIFDLSSLTKPLATVMSCMVLVAHDRLGLDDRVVDHLPEFACETEPGRARVRVRDLLGHRSGLPAWKAFYEAVAGAMSTMRGTRRPTARSRLWVAELACRAPLQAGPGREAVYSDVGFIVLGTLLERLTGETLDAFVARELLAPLRLHDTGFMAISDESDDAVVHRGPGLDVTRIAPCGTCPWRGGLVRGVVHDLNAYAMGGVAGHAGLFATARDVHALVAEHLAAASGRGAVLDGSAVCDFWSLDRREHGQTWLLGWDTPTPGASSAGRRVDAAAVGHLGFTGTSVWIDRRRGVHVVFLTNRVHAGDDAGGIKRLRPLLHDAVFEVMDAELG